MVYQIKYNDSIVNTYQILLSQSKQIMKLDAKPHFTTVNKPQNFEAKF